MTGPLPRRDVLAGLEDGTVPCHRCHRPVRRARAVERIDGELYHPGCPGPRR